MWVTVLIMVIIISPWGVGLPKGCSWGQGWGHTGEAPLAPGTCRGTPYNSGPGHRRRLRVARALQSCGFESRIHCSGADLEGQKLPRPLTPNRATPNSALGRAGPDDRSAKGQSGHLVTLPATMGPGSRSWGTSLASISVGQGGCQGQAGLASPLHVSCFSSGTTWIQAHGSPTAGGVSPAACKSPGREDPVMQECTDTDLAERAGKALGKSALSSSETSRM